MRAIVSRPLVVVLLAVSAPCASASDIHVPADYPTIQAAIDAAVAGDVVLVSPGTYFEHLDFKGKAITVQSTDGAAVTTIDGTLTGSCVRFVSGEGNDSILRSFTLTDGGVPGYTGHRGGGVDIQYASPTVEENVIVWNTAQNGGGISNVYSNAVIQRNVIAFNHGTGQGGGICVDTGSAPLIANNVIYGNLADGGGGGIHAFNSTPLIVNSTVSGNSSPAVFCAGGAVAGAWNSIVWGNTGTQISVDRSSSFNATSCDVQGGWNGTGNFDADPLFVDPPSSDYHLGPGSLCIDAGDNSAPSLPATDIDGDPRILGPAVDVGADEFKPPLVVSSITPNRMRYDGFQSVSIVGSGYSLGAWTIVLFGQTPAANVVVIDDQNIACDAPSGEPGPIDITVSNDLGDGVLSNGFTYTPATILEGTFTPGGSVTVNYLCDPLDGIFAIYGLPPEQSIPTPPFHGDLCILPFNFLTYIPSWPFDVMSFTNSIPNDPSLSGVDVLLQALVGPKLTTPPKDGAWTNCAVLSIH